MWYNAKNMNKLAKILGVVMLISFFVTAVFGFSMMRTSNDAHLVIQHESHEVHTAPIQPTPCILHFINTSVCLLKNETFSMSMHHISAYQSFFSSTENSLASVALALAAIVSCSVLLYIFSDQSLVSQKNQNLFQSVFIRTQPMSFAYSLALQKESRWLTRKENSPSHS
jgi:hypothetical protein